MKRLLRGDQIGAVSSWRSLQRSQSALSSYLSPYADHYQARRRQWDQGALLRRAARIRADGASRALPDHGHQRLSDFAFSFDLDCPDLVVYSPEQACDLVSSFGGVYFQGDSLLRHVLNAFVMLLANDTSAAVSPPSSECTGELLFREKAACFHSIVYNSSQVSLCGPDRPMHWKYNSRGGAELYHWGEDRYAALDDWRDWREHGPDPKLSEVLIVDIGMHISMSHAVASEAYLRPYAEIQSSLAPTPIALFSGVGHPGSNKPIEYHWNQGAAVVQQYNADVHHSISKLWPDGAIERGDLGFLDWSGVTSGAASFDGTHFSYQVNMEKVQIILNVLDAVWHSVR